MSAARPAGNRPRANTGRTAANRPRANTGRTGSTARTRGGPVTGTFGVVRLFLYALLLVAGAVVAAAGALVQAGWFPGGLILSLLAAVGLFLGAGRALESRAAAVAPAVGWMITVVLLTSNRPEGDFTFAAGIGSYLFLLGGMALAVMCATLWQPSQSASSAA